jgi:hypothetical protein
MTMNASEVTYDLVLTGARICDPATASPPLDAASHRPTYEGENANVTSLGSRPQARSRCINRR